MFGHKRDGLLYKELRAISDFASHKPVGLDSCHHNLNECSKHAERAMKILEHFEDNFDAIVKKIEEDVEEQL